MLIHTIVTAFVSFASTNIDDIFLLMLFFAQTKDAVRKKHIILGQYLGIGFLTLISIIGALGLSLIPYQYVGFLGFVPIYLGIKALVNYAKEMKTNKVTAEKKLHSLENIKLKSTTDNDEKTIITFLINFFSADVIKMSTITIANGGDNIGIYIPLFTRLGLIDMIATVIIFIILVALWCFIAIKLVKHCFIQGSIEKYSDILTPLVFIALGIFILYKNGALNFLLMKVL